jgi:glycyl-tRNA synthetase beta chain
MPATPAAAHADLLIELGCEDLPARFVRPLAEALGGIGDRLRQRGVAAGAPRLFATPRRIAVRVQGIAPRQADQEVERKGPKLAAALKDGQPTPAGLGFARSCGVEFSALAQENGQLVFRSVQKGRATAELLPEIFEEALAAMDELVPKRMRWGSGDETFVRPVQWIVALLGAKVVPLRRFGLAAGRVTRGHRFHAPKAIALKTPADYEKKLKAAKVWADFASRRDEIRRQVEAQAAKLKGTARITESLLDEVTALVEWPVAIHGRMEERFLALPPEVVIATIEHNQRYFPVFGADGRLLPAFITVANLQSRDVAQVIAGNERVVRPRLTDALFFWEQDRKRNLLEYVPELDRVTFQKDLGSVGAKARRVADLARLVATQVGEDPAAATGAARLAKADLVTRMVFEFPELQGIMGAYYAEASGVSAEVVRAIREHYQPVQSGSPIPSSAAGRIVALADKLDTLAGIFAIGQKPTASKDPYGLRRAALGIVRILVEGQISLDLAHAVGEAVRLQPGEAAKQSDVRTLLADFITERMRHWMVETRGCSVETFDAAHLAEGGTFNPLDIVRRVEAVTRFQALPEAQALAAAHKRIRNILKQAGEGGIEVNPEAFREAPETGLYEALTQLDGSVHDAAKRGDYAAGLKALARLQKPVDAFFDKVMVLAPEEELRANRVALLRRLDRLCRSIADLSCLPG